ncbi:Type I restriction-modification system, restriction subunit R [Rhodovulum sp. PH10]|uniref:DEAD/DEAH box helicase family protein n=1 Tax=Rhodovulum sp. PH10 TaxID=1187851 RepID=UPI00027C2C42|nr:DEAD/DEAH box helicase family protein [Rhodovulum sp. PH10]EJW11614.1 Type I restriction-modification system, restriction subunit R [Rhodovulum sp. PH10]
MSQFAFLQAEFPEIFAHASRAESLVHGDPRSAAFYGRLALETAVGWLYRHDGSLKHPFERTLAALIAEPTFQTLVGRTLAVKARFVKDTGNAAAHGKPVSPGQAATAVRELFHVAYWLARTYARGEKPAADVTFSMEALPRLTEVPATTLARLQEIGRRFKETIEARDEAEAARRASEDGRAALEAELAAVRAEIAATKAANQAIPDTHDYSEAETRDLFIDLLLREAGFDPQAPGCTEVPVTGMPNGTGQGFVDYVLRGDDGKPLALVEAKRTRKDPAVGRQQAKLYADCLEAQHGQRPVIFYTNGYEHWMWDDTRYPPRPIQGFLAKDELALLIQRRSTRKPLAPEDIDRAIVERPYQHRAIRRITEAFERDKQRKALVVMATGAGKTRTVIALCDLLMRANWVKRTLFLADRTALVKQAANAFKAHLPGAATVNLLEDKRQEGRVYVSTYPTMMGLIDETDVGGRRFGVGHFDLVVIDEAHRSVYRKYRAIFEYFDSLLVGLTATPKDEVDRDTYRLFDLQTGVPTDAYGLDEAVEDGFLVPPRAVSLTTDFLDRGIRYDQLTDDEKEAWDALEWSDDGTVPGAVEAPAINKWLFNADTVDRVLQHLMENGQKVADGDRLGKTIVFAKNHDHAEFIARRFDVAYPHLAGRFARVIDFQVNYAQSLIDAFSDPDKDPHIAISVDMLDTGIDVPEVVNLVFFKPVRSKTKFWQMIGRGTRLCPNLFGPGSHKEFFYVFDWCRNFEFFDQNPQTTEGSGGESLGKRLFTARVDIVATLDGARPAHGTGGADCTYTQVETPVLHAGEPGSEVDRAAEVEALRDALAVDLRAEVSGMSLDNFLVRPKRRFVEKYRTEAPWQRIDADARQELVEHVAGLPSAVTDDDLAAKQFDLLVFRAELALLRVEASFQRLRKQITDTAASLELLANVPMVAAEMALIHEVQTDAFWQDVTLPMLETVRRRLRALVKLIEPGKRPLVYSDFEDRTGTATEITVAGISVGTDLAAFRRKARVFLKPFENHLAILKLRRNEPLTPTDLVELERIFTEAGVDEESIDRLKTDGGLGRFVRSLIGLDREAAKLAFAEFLDGRNPTANQLEFVGLVIDHLTERGVMDPKLLYETPFTDFDTNGVEGVFPEPDVRRLVQILRDVEARTAA